LSKPEAKGLLLPEPDAVKLKGSGKKTVASPVVGNPPGYP
jgi:hypothetical protein